MTATEPTSHEEWVLAALDRHEQALLRYARRLTGDDSTARDAVQHTFMKLCEQSQSELAGREAPWLYRVCRNKATDHLRDQTRLAQLDGKAMVFHTVLPGPAEICETGDLAQRLGRLVTKLPPAQREALDLWCEGLRVVEIAQITGHSRSNVRVLLHRALKQLREHPAVRELMFEKTSADPSG